MIIDIHTHIFPDALAPRAIASLQLTAKLPAVFDGTAKGLLTLMDADGIDKAVVLNTVTNLKQVDKVNAFAMETKGCERLIPFCSLHPLTENPEELLFSFKEQGIKGIKLHPDYLGVDIDDRVMFPLLSAIAKVGLPVVIHAGYDPVSPSKIHATPKGIYKVLDKHPDLTLIAAHLGGVAQWDEVYTLLCGADLYMDTAFCCERVGLTLKQADKIFSRHPCDKILFGSDAPWARPLEILDFINKLGLGPQETDLLLSGNARRLLDI